jgi:hypothetical protein
VILFGNRVFIDDQVKVKSLGWALIQYYSVLAKMGNLGEKETQREDDMNTWGKCHPQSKECLRLSEAQKESWDKFFLTTLRSDQPCRFWASSLHHCETINFWVWSI